MKNLDEPNQPMFPKRKQMGFTLIEILFAAALIGILSALAVKPIKGYLQNIKLRNAAEATKYLILNTRSRAMANPMLHCGVVFKMNSTLADSIFAFMDNSNSGGSKNVYNPGSDSLYLQPIIFKPADSLNIISVSPTTIVFRGDGSANTSLAVKLKLYGFTDSINVLASTGRVKVITK